MTLVLLDDAASPLVMARVPQGEARREHRLRDLIFASPEILPVNELDPGFGRIVAVTRELNVPGVGFIDVLLIDERGRLVIVECKLWRNPQATRRIGEYLRAQPGLAFDFGLIELAEYRFASHFRRGVVDYQDANRGQDEVDHRRSA